jgi:hypothetical protein
MANPARGEVELVIGGETHTLCLTLGALAEIETICADGARLDATRLVRVLAALLRGGGSALTEADLKTAPLALDTAAGAVAACFEAGQA